jgi:DNA-binding NtrC family response regulator
MEKILVVEDVQSVRDQLKWGLGSDYVILQGGDRQQAMELFLNHAPKVVTLDLGLPPDPEGTSVGFSCLESMMESRPWTKVVVVTGKDDRETTKRALSCGAYDYCHKPLDIDHLKNIIRRALHLAEIEEQSARLQEAVIRGSASIAGIVGQVSAMQELFAPLGKSVQPVMEPHRGAVGAARADQHVTAWGPLHPPEENGVHPLAGWEAGAAPGSTLREARDKVEKEMITSTVRSCSGNVAKAAELLGISRPALYDLMKKHGLFKGGHHHRE